MIQTAQGTGGIAAAVWAGWLTEHLSPGRTLSWGLFVLSVLAVLMAAAAPRPVTIVCTFLTGPHALVAEEVAGSQGEAACALHAVAHRPQRSLIPLDEVLGKALGS